MSESRPSLECDEPQKFLTRYLFQIYKSSKSGKFTSNIGNFSTVSPFLNGSKITICSYHCIKCMITISFFQSFSVFNGSLRLIYLFYADEAKIERPVRKTRADVWFIPIHVHKQISMQHKFAINNKYLVIKRCFHPSPEIEHVLNRTSFF